MSYKIICMSFDGEYQTERPEFETLRDAWDYASDLGSKWYFYPFCFVVSASGKTVIDTPEQLERFKGKRLSTVEREFNYYSKLPELENADCNEFAWAIG